MRVLNCMTAVSLLFATVIAAAAQKGDKAKDSKAKEDKGKKEAKAEPSGDASLAALYPQPGEVHKEMVKAEQGVWDATMKAYFAGPGQPPTEFKGVETVRAIADGMFLVSDFEADFIGGKKFKGHGISGYDTQKKKLVGVWADNMGTGIGTLEGDYVPKATTVTMWFETLDPMTGKLRKDKHVTEYKGDGHKVYTIYMAAPGGGKEQIKLMEIESKRRSDESGKKAGESKDIKAKEGK